MDVKSLRIEAFKSLYGVNCVLDHFTVITGPNGSGKSNLVDAMNFIGEVYAHGLEFAVSRAGGYENIAHRRTRRAKHPISFSLEARVTAAELETHLRHVYFEGTSRKAPRVPRNYFMTFRHGFSFRASSQTLLSDFQVTSDEIELLGPEGESLVLIKRDGGRIAIRHQEDATENPWLERLLYPFVEDFYEEFLSERAKNATALITDAPAYAGVVGLVTRALARTRVFQLSPYQCRAAGVSTPNAVLERHGQNLPGAADHLRRNDERAWEQVQAAMRAVLPSLTGIELVPTEDRRLALQFRERGVGRPWNTGEISDGTIQALALFIALYDRRTPLLVVEEPENSLHPWLLRQFLDLCQEVEAKQVVLTSHSPVLLNYVRPESVRLMSIDNGRSTLQLLVDVEPELRAMVTSGQLTTFDLYDSGVLANAVPKGFSPATHEQDK